MPHLASVPTAPGAAVAAPVDLLWQLATELTHFPALSPTILHTERTPLGPDGDLVEIWTVTADEQVWSRISRRTFDRAAGRITFVDETSGGTPTGVRGAWQFTPAADGRVIVELSQEVDDPADAQRYEASRLDLLGTVTDAAARRAELADLVVDFADPLFVSGRAEDAYQILYEADKWPQRLPHVSRIDLLEVEPNIQFFDMDTTTQDAKPHTTRSVRLCFPYGKIIYKQIGLPPLLNGHTGHWLFTPERDGLIIEARHTAVIRPEALPLLAGPDTTIQDARRYLRKVLSTNSMTNLRLAKEFAEVRTDA